MKETRRRRRRKRRKAQTTREKCELKINKILIDNNQQKIEW